VEFAEFSLEATIEKLREYADIAYIKDSKKEKGKVTKILVFPKKEGEELSKPPLGKELAKPESGVEEEAPRPETFKFEFDPSEFEERSSY
jgi:hypothetical protein